MKYVYIFLIFIFGIALGRWSVPDVGTGHTYFESIVRPGSHANVAQEMHPVEAERIPKRAEGNSSPKESMLPSKPGEENQSLARTDDKARDKHVRKLFDLLMEANEKDDIEEQNRLFTEMEKLESKHEKVFQAKAMFLQDDENWDGAHEVLEECVTTIPDSVYCHRRLANIRSSTIEDKLRYGTRCLQIAKNDPLCIVDVAMALHSKGEFAKSKNYFEQALNLPLGGEGYNKEYILFQYALTLESLHMYQKAKEAFTEACRLNMKSACEKIKT